MANELFSNIFEQHQSFLAPLVKANQQVIADLGKVVDFQLKAWQAYTDLGLERLKATTEVRDPESLQKFISDQFDVVGTLAQKLMTDAQAPVRLTAGIRAELGELAQETVGGLGEESAQTTHEVKGVARKKA